MSPQNYPFHTIIFSPKSFHTLLTIKYSFSFGIKFINRRQEQPKRTRTNYLFKMTHLLNAYYIICVLGHRILRQRMQSFQICRYYAKNLTVEGISELNAASRQSYTFTCCIKGIQVKNLVTQVTFATNFAQHAHTVKQNLRQSKNLCLSILDRAETRCPQFYLQQLLPYFGLHIHTYPHGCLFNKAVGTHH